MTITQSDWDETQRRLALLELRLLRAEEKIQCLEARDKEESNPMRPEDAYHLQIACGEESW